MSYTVVNSNNKPWTLAKYLAGSRYKPFKLGKRNPEFEQDLRKTLPEITKGELREFRQQLIEMSRSSKISGIEDTDVIKYRKSPPPADIKLYLQRGEGKLHPQIYEILKRFHELYLKQSLGYEGADVHDCGHLLTGFQIDHRGEAQQVVFDMYFQHLLKGLMAKETLALSLKPSFKLARLASSYMSLKADLDMMFQDKDLAVLDMINAESYVRKTHQRTIHQIDNELKRTYKLYEQVLKVSLNKWTFPDGHDAKLVDKSFRDVESLLEHRVANSHKIPFYSSFQEHWLEDEEIEDIGNYAHFCALKCMGNLANLSPENNKTVQQVMDENGYFNMELFERSTGLGTDKELKLPTYEEWREMLSKKPSIDYNKLITQATQSIEARR